MNLLVLRFMTMNAEDVKRDDGDTGSRCGGLSLDGEFSNFTNGFNNKLATIDSKTNNEAAVEFDQVSVCSCTGCTCFGPTTNLFGLSNSRPVERKTSDAGSFTAKRKSGGRWATQIHVHEAKSWRNWRRPSSTSSSRRSGSRLSRLTFGIDSIFSGQDTNVRPVIQQLPLKDIYTNFQSDFNYSSRVKRASI